MRCVRRALIALVLIRGLSPDPAHALDDVGTGDEEVPVEVAEPLPGEPAASAESADPAPSVEADAAPEAPADEPPAIEDPRSKRLGFYFAISLNRMSQLGHAPGVGLVIDRPGQPGAPFAAVGDQVDADFGARYDLGMKFGFRLRGNHGNVEASFFQWDSNENLLTVAGDGKSIANTLSSADAGYFEDVGANSTFAFPGPPDGSVIGFETGFAGEGSEQADRALDGAEDVNFNTVADFIRFASSDRIVGSMHTDYQNFDLDWTRPIQRLRRFTLSGRVGLRAASVTQEMDLGYREMGSFAVYIDDEGLAGMPEDPGSDPCPRNDVVHDGDGDGESTTMQNEPDGDGFMNGDCDIIMRDRVESVETVSEDRIIADIDTTGMGLKLGLDGTFDLTQKWRLVGAVAVSAMSSKTEWRYLESFTSERDRFLNYIDWDFNGDGEYDNRDLDFDRSCVGLPPEDCIPTREDDLALDPTLPGANTGFVDISGRPRTGPDDFVGRARIGLLESRVRSPQRGTAEPRGVNPGAFTGANATMLRIGDPVPESERNRDVLRETTLLRNLSGESSGITSILDLHVGLEFQFSKFAHVGFGLRATRWFDAGRFRNLANDVVDGRDPEADGDFGLHGAYVVMTVVPR